MADGHLNKCKECAKKDVKDRATSPDGRELVRAYDKARFQSAERKAKIAVYRRRYRIRHVDKYRARTAVGNAVRDGRLIKQPCEVCGKTKVQAHHDDYRKKLQVRWLCFRHHREAAHGQIVGPII